MGAKFVDSDDRFVEEVKIFYNLISYTDTYIYDDLYKFWSVNLNNNRKPVLSLYGVDFEKHNVKKYDIKGLVRSSILSENIEWSQTYLKILLKMSNIQEMQTDHLIIGRDRVLDTLNYLAQQSDKGIKRVKFATEKDVNNTINTGSLRYRTFLKSLSCVSCGLEGVFLALQRSPENIEKDTGWHYNLYAIDDCGEAVLLTKDHIVPRSKGGKDKIENMQCMCSRCNGEKGSQLFWTKED